MLTKCVRAGLFAAFGLGAVVLTLGGSGASRAEDKKDEKLPDISEIMKKGHAKTDGYLAKITAEAKGEKWDDAKKDAAGLHLLAEALGKNKPPKGSAESWEKLTKKYLDNTKAIEAGIEKKDAKAVNAAVGKIGMSCGECHGQHKPK